MIKSVRVQGDLVEIETKVNGEKKIIRRHVQDYDKLTLDQRKDIWDDMIGKPELEYTRNWIKKLKLKLTSKH